MALIFAVAYGFAKRRRERDGLRLRAYEMSVGGVGMRGTLSALGGVFGAVCLVIPLRHMTFGPAANSGSMPVNATMESEDRFYALMWCSFNLAARMREFSALLAMFFRGGVRRIVPAGAVGRLGLSSVFLGSSELLLPPLLWVWAKLVYREAGSL